MMKKTVVIGASTNPHRYSNIVSHLLNDEGYEFVPVGVGNGEILGQNILDIRKKPVIENVHTVTLYLNPIKQREWYDYILSLRPKRLIFNPGAENSELGGLAERQGIKVEYACNLVLLRTGQY